jgi:predicted TIM-barrel fold metal-dependent hydrolase
MRTKGGARKVLFGSNYPMIAPAAALEDLDGIGLDETAARLYLHENARRVFALAQPAQARQPLSAAQPSRA